MKPFDYEKLSSFYITQTSIVSAILKNMIRKRIQKIKQKGAMFVAFVIAILFPLISFFPKLPFYSLELNFI